jgi:hypothetical protein
MSFTLLLIYDNNLSLDNHIQNEKFNYFILSKNVKNIK